MSTLRFLLLEDNPLDAELVQLTLLNSAIGFELLRVETRADFVAALKTDEFDLILADYALPNFDGISALEIACNLRPDIPFIFVSANLGEELAIEALKRGATDYVLKQRLERLVPCVQRALREAQERCDRKQAARMLIEQKQLLELIASGQPLDDCLAAVCAAVSRLSPRVRACFLLTDAQRLMFKRFITPDLLPSFGQGLQNAPINDLCIGTCGTAVYCGQPVTCADIAHDDRWSQEWRSLCIAHGILACHSKPVMGIDNLPLGSLMLCFDEARMPTDWEYQLAEFGAQVASIGFERDRASLALRQNEARLRTVAANLPNGAVFVVDHDLRYLLAEGNALQAAGMTSEDLVGKTLWEALDPDLATRYEPYYRQALGGEPFNLEHCSHDRDYVSHGTPLRNDQGEVDTVLVMSYDITDRVRGEDDLKQSEAALRESEELKQSILESSQDCIKVLTLDGRVSYISPGGLCLLEIDDPASILNTVWADRWQGDDHKKANAAIAAATRGNIGKFQGYLPTAKGTPKWWDNMITPVRDADGQVVQLVAISRDTTTARHAEVALRESEEQSRNILESITDAFFAVDQSWQFTYVNRSAEVLLDRLPSDLIGKNFWEAYPGVTGNEFETVYRKAMDDLVPGTLTAFYPDHDRWYDIRTYPAANGIAVYFNDVTDRKQAEAALRQSESRFRLVVESAKDYAIISLDLNGVVTSWNSGAERLLGYSEAEIIGRDGRIIFTPEDLEQGKADREMHLALTQGQAENERWHLRKDGSRFWGSGLMMPLQDEAVTTQGFVKIMQDKTAQRQSEAEREQLLQQEQSAREAAERANRIKDEFLAVLSHELRSPLNPILGWTRLLQNGKLDATRQAEALKTIERNAKLQSQLIEDLLDISRIMQGKLSLTAAPVSLTFVIFAALETVRLAAEAKTIQITLDLDSTIAPIMGDAARLQQVVWNLLTNAVKFTPNGGQVTVELRQLNHLAQIRVIDSGKGINAQFLPHVFEYFRQEDGSTTRRFGGLGLGLAIVRQIVEMHGGTVEAKSAGENQGAAFIVELPMIQQTAPIVPEPICPQTDLEMPLDNLQILLVDDDTDTREFQAFLLEQNGAKVTAVISGLEALQALDRFIPDLIVSDVGMAEMDGYMLMQQIRSQPHRQGRTIPAIALTAYAAELDQQKALQAGFQKHLTKPVEPETLVREITNLLKLNQL